MGRPQTFTLSETTTRSRDFSTVRRVADVALSLVLLVVTAPLMAAVALLVRVTSHGPVLHRDPVAGPRGYTTERLTFRVTVDGGTTEAHARMRAVVGAKSAWTPVGRQLRRLGLDRLPQLVNVLRGEASLFSRG